MNRSVFLLNKILIFTLFTITFFGIFITNNKVFATEGDPQWARSTFVGPNQSAFLNTTNDSSGNVYAVGYVSNNGQFDFGNNVTIAGVNNINGYNAVIVKYNSSGTAQWAKSAVAGTNQSRFDSVLTDASGNIYVTGFIYGTTQLDFGNNVTVAGTNTTNNALIVKYNSDGVAQWARSTVAGSNISVLYDTVMDSSGNIYAVGMIYGNSQYDFGNNITVTGTYAGNKANILIIKYNSDGVAQWAKSTVAGQEQSRFGSVSIDPSGNLYAVGIIYSNVQFNFGNGVTATGTYAGSNSVNAVIVKYNYDGIAQWAKSTVVGANNSYYYSTSTDSSGNIYAAGYILGNSQYNFGNDITVTGTCASLQNPVIVKYNSSGVVQWAKSTVVGTNQSWFNGISIDSQDNIYTVGLIKGNSQFDFGNNVIVTGTYASSANVVIVKYNAGGATQWAKSTIVATNVSNFSNISIDSSNNIYTVGYILGNAQFNFGNNVTVTGGYAGASNSNALLIKYEGAPLPTPGPTIYKENISDEKYQIPGVSSGNIVSGVLTPVKDSVIGLQKVISIIESGTINSFNAFFSVKSKPNNDNNLIRFNNSTTGNSVAWQVGSVHEIWYKAYPPSGSDRPPAIIIPSLLNKPSILSLSYLNSDLIPPGDISHPFDSSSLALAYSPDGITNWVILDTSVVDTVNNTVSAVTKVGGYYTIVSNTTNLSAEALAKEDPTNTTNENVQGVTNEEKTFKEVVKPTIVPTSNPASTPKPSFCFLLWCW